MDEQRRWQERWGVNDFDVHHWLGLIGVALVLLAPVVALTKGEAGWVFLIVGLLMFWWAVIITPEAK